MPQTNLSARLNSSPIHVHQQTETDKNYAQVLVHLICAILRGGPPCLPFPTSPTVDHAVAAVKHSPSVDTLHALLASLWLNPWEDDNNKYADPTLCFLALHLLNDDGVFKPPHLVTPIIARITRMIRLTALRECHRLVGSGQSTTLRESLDQVLPYLYDGSGVCTMQTLRYHQRLATTLANSTPGLPRIVYHRAYKNDFTTFYYCGNLVSIPTLQTLFAALEQEAIRVWNDEVMLGIPLNVPIGQPPDNLLDTTKGYSCFHRPQSQFQTQFSLLGRNILQDEVHRAQFISIDPTTGTLTFKAGPCHRWFQSLARVEALLMILVEMRSGAPIRLSELASTLACNTTTRSRNLYAYGTELLIVSQYTKTTSLHGRDRLVPHSLSSFDANLLTQIHVLARPFAQVTTLPSTIHPITHPFHST